MKTFLERWLLSAFAAVLIVPFVSPARADSGLSATVAGPPTPTPAGPPASSAGADLDAASYLFQRGRYAAALPLAERAVAATPESVAARDLLGQVLTKLDRPDEAVASLTRAAGADPRNADVLVHLGEAQLTQFAAGIRTWRHVHGDNPMLGTITSDIPGALAGGSARYSPEGGPVLGQTNKTAVLTRNPNERPLPRFDPGRSAMGMLRRSVTDMNVKEREKYEAPARAALATFEKALTLSPDSIGARRGRAYAIFSLGDYAEAGEAFDSAVEVARTDIGLNEMAADSYARADRPNDSIRAWESVINLNPAHPEAYRHLRELYGTFRRSRWEGRYYSAMERLLDGRPEKALKDLDWITTHRPEFAPGWRATGSAYIALKKPDLAIQNLDKALELDPGNGLTEYELGVAYMRRGEIPEARSRFTKAASLRPDYAPAWFSLGVTAEREKDPDSAIAAYEKAVALRPNWAEAHYNLGALLLDRRFGAEAVEHLEQYIALKPNAADASEVRKALDEVRARLS